MDSQRAVNAVVLSVLSRIILLDIMPTRGRARDLRLSMAVRAKVGISDEETKRIGLVQTDSKCTWDAEKEAPFSVEFTDDEMDMVVSRLTQLDREQALTAQMLPLLDAFGVKGEGE